MSLILSMFGKMIGFGAPMPAPVSGDVPANALLETTSGSALLETTSGQYLVET